MDNPETILQCLNDFETAKDKKVGPELDELLSHIARTGRTEFPWHLLKPLVAYKLERVLEEFFENNSSIDAYLSEPTSKTKDLYPDAQKLIGTLNRFTGTPFTIQRLCELIIEPKKYYKTTDKFLRGIEKNIMVVSTVQPDGSLITRSLSTPLTNGNLSPTKTNVECQNLTPLNNSPLNTIAQDQSAITTTTVEVTPEEKTESQANEENCVDNSVNITQDSECEQPAVARNIVQCSDNEENILKVVEDSEHTSAMDSVVNCIENGTSDKTVDAIEKEEIITKSDTPITEEKTTLDEEKMEEC